MRLKNTKKCSLISEKNKSVRESKKCGRTPKIRKKAKYFIFDFFEIQSEQMLINPRQIQLLSCQGFFCQPKKTV